MLECSKGNFSCAFQALAEAAAVKLQQHREPEGQAKPSRAEKGSGQILPSLPSARRVMYWQYASVQLEEQRVVGEEKRTTVLAGKTKHQTG